MATTYKKLKYDENPTMCDVAERDSAGNVIKDTYVSKSDIESEASLRANADTLLQGQIDVLSKSKVGLSGDETISGTKTFSSPIKTDEIDNTNGNAIARYKSTENKVVLGGSTIPTTIMGSGDRPTYSKNGSDFDGEPLALLSDVSGGGGVSVKTKTFTFTTDMFYSVYENRLEYDSEGITVSTEYIDFMNRNNVILNELIINSYKIKIKTGGFNIVTEDESNTIFICYTMPFNDNEDFLSFIFEESCLNINNSEMLNLIYQGGFDLVVYYL